MDNKEKLSIDNILVGTSIPSSIRRHSPKGVSYYMKNFNDATFEGVFKVQAIYDGIVIVSEHVHEITLEGDEFFSNYTPASEFNNEEFNVSRSWEAIDINIVFEGEFIE